MVKEIKDVNEIKAITGLSHDEKETCICIAYDDTFASLTTNDNTWISKMKTCFQINKQEFICVQQSDEKSGEIYSYTFTFPKKYVSIRSKKVERKAFTEEQKAAAAERLKLGRAKKKATD